MLTSAVATDPEELAILEQEAQAEAEQEQEAGGYATLEIDPSEGIVKAVLPPINFGGAPAPDSIVEPWDEEETAPAPIRQTTLMTVDKPGHTLTMAVLAKLREPFPAKKHSVKIQSRSKDKKKAMLVAFVDARDVMQRLDDVVGGSWSDAYDTAAGKAGVQCTITVCGVSRTDVGDDDNDNEPTKSGYSDAFKRAAVKFGIGRYLYDFPKWWVDIDADERFLSDVEQDRIRAKIAVILGESKPTGQKSSAPARPPAPAKAEPATVANGAAVPQAVRAPAPEQAQAHPPLQQEAAQAPVITGNVPHPGPVTQKTSVGMGAPLPQQNKVADAKPPAASQLAHFKVKDKIRVWGEWVQKFLPKYPQYALKNLPGTLDQMHLMGAAFKCGFTEVTDENYQKVLKAIAERADKGEDASAAPARAAQAAPPLGKDRLAKAGF